MLRGWHQLQAWLLRILTNSFASLPGWEREQESWARRNLVTRTSVSFRVRIRATPESALSAACSLATWRQALADLACRVPLPVILADLEDLSYKEIADVMECPAGTVMSRLYRGRKLLQKRLHDYAVESGIIRAQQGPSPKPSGKWPRGPKPMWSIWTGFGKTRQEGG